MANKTKRKGKVSKGERQNITKSIVNTMRQMQNYGFKDILNKFKALEKGLNPKILVPNTDSKTNRREQFVKIPLRELVYGEFKK